MKRAGGKLRGGGGSERKKGWSERILLAGTVCFIPSNSSSVSTSLARPSLAIVFALGYVAGRKRIPKHASTPIRRLSTASFAPERIQDEIEVEASGCGPPFEEVAARRGGRDVSLSGKLNSENGGFEGESVRPLEQGYELLTRG